MPKSMNPTLPSSHTIRFPACTSAWKLSHASTLPNHTLSAFTNVASGSPLDTFRMASRSVNATPLKYSMVITLFPLNCE